MRVKKDSKTVLYNRPGAGYIAFLAVSALFTGLLIWSTNGPQEIWRDQYRVHCGNEESGYAPVGFDPLSKPISRVEPELDPFGRPVPWKIIEFDEAQIKSECAYGTPSRADKTRHLPKNYKLTVSSTKETIGTRQNQIVSTVAVVVVFCLLAELIRLSVMFIFLNRNFIKIRPIDHLLRRSRADRKGSKI